MNFAKILGLSLLGSFLMILPIQAQSGMSDEQLMQYIIRENARGTSKQAVVSQLIERGVQIDQIRRVRDIVEREQQARAIGAKDLTGSTKGRARLRRGKKSQDTRGDNSMGRRSADQDPYSKEGLTERERLLLREQQEDDYGNALNFILPDSLLLYEEAYNRQKRLTRQVFGRNIFNQKNLSFEPNMNIATPADYRLGPGDEVFIDIWGASQKSVSSAVSPDGTIEIEGYGPVAVNGLTVAQANERLRSTVGSRYHGSSIRLTIGETKTMLINVMGEVVMPGTYTLSAFATVFHALYAAGGVNDIGTLRNIKVYRSGRLVTTVDVYDYILNGKLTGNIRLSPNDVIVVGAYDALVNVSGRVKRPMYYEMKTNESVGTLLKYAGGFTGDAYPGNMRLFRKSDGLRSVFNIGEFDRTTFHVHDGDSLVVDSVLDRYRNMVNVQGAVFRPGMYQMDGATNTVRQVLVQAGGVREDAYVARAVLRRRKADRTLEALSLDIDGIVSGRVADVPLRNEDIIYIPSQEDLQQERIFTIYGEVFYPGVYEYAENTTVADLVLQAGGLKDAASLMKVDVSRRYRNNKATQASTEMAQSFTFAFKDGLELDGASDFRLEPYDEVYIRRSPDYVEQHHVEIRGEVAFEGTYTISSKNQRLSDLIKMAGGLNAGAYVRGARLERRTTEDEKSKQRSLLQSKMLSKKDSTLYASTEIKDYHAVGINLDEAMAHPGDDRWDVVLVDGDRLTVPLYNNTVTISGEVMSPNTVPYRVGAGLKDYINAAGGYSLEAKKGRAYAVNANGMVTRVRSSKDIEPGSTIVVPVKSERKRISFTEILGLGSLVASLITAITLLVTNK